MHTYAWLSWACDKQGKMIGLPALFMVLMCMAWGGEGGRLFVVIRDFDDGNCSTGKPLVDAGKLIQPGYTCLPGNQMSRTLHCQEDGSVMSHWFEGMECAGNNIRNETYMQCEGGEQDAYCMNFDTVFQYRYGCRVFTELGEESFGHVVPYLCDRNKKGPLGVDLGSSIAWCEENATVHQVYDSPDCTGEYRTLRLKIKDSNGCADIEDPEYKSDPYRYYYSGKIHYGGCVAVPDLPVSTPRPTRPRSSIASSLPIDLFTSLMGLLVIYLQQV